MCPQSAPSSPGGPSPQRSSANTKRERGPLEVLGRRLLLRTVALFAVLVLVVGWQVQRLASAAERIQRADEARSQTHLLLYLAVERETNLRAYLLTRAPVFLDTFADTRVAPAFDRLTPLVSSWPTLVDHVAALRAAYSAWRDAAWRALADPDAESSTDAVLARKVLMDSVRASGFALLREEERLYAERARQLAIETSIAEVGGAAALLLVAVLATLMSRRETRRVAAEYEGALARAVASESAASAAITREIAARRQSEEALRLKDEFLSTLSHELRTPLTSVLGWASLLRSRKLAGEQLERAVVAIERGARAEARIVDDLLDASRIAAGKVQLSLKPTLLNEVVSSAADMCRELAGAKGVVLEVAPVRAAVVVRGDADRLRQVFWNLLTNAIKFTPSGRSVSIEMTPEADRVTVRVRDEGEGISPEFLPHVFERFRQADSSHKRAHGGLGLGLAIARHFVELHGGAIEAESAGLGQGSTFSVSLQRAEGEAARVAPRAPAPPGSLHGKRVLVVEDDVETLAMTSAALEGQGAEVRRAALGTDALAILERVGVDAIVSDVGLPDIDGYSLLARMRTQHGAIPAIAVTAYARPDDLMRTHLAGYDRHLAKPFSPEHLIAALAELLACGPRSPDAIDTTGP